MQESLLKAGERTAQRVLLPRLLEQIGSHVVPFRPGRHYPRPHDTQVKNKGKGKKQLPSKLGAGENAQSLGDVGSKTSLHRHVTASE